MTKATAENVKKIINKDRHHKTNFQSKTGELRVRVYTYTDSADYDEEMEKSRIKEITNNIEALPYRIEHKTYQGFIHDTFVVIY